MFNRVCVPLDQVADALSKTGFILEHQVAQEFRSAGWYTIGGRYYADDVDGRARELDLVAYRADDSKEIEVVTAVLVSCKKSEVATWAFLTKERPKSDPNFDWDPVHYWTDVQPLRPYLATDKWKPDYIKAAGALYERSFQASKDVFAFQELAMQALPKGNKAAPRVVPRNDSAIFDSVVTLMKALDHELETVQARAKGRKRVYVFVLLSVVDAPMIDATYSAGEPVITEVNQLTHLARYMVRKRELSALIHFVRGDKVPDVVAALSKLADTNLKHMASLVDKSYEAIKWNAAVQDYFAERLKWRVIMHANRTLRRAGLEDVKVEKLEVAYGDGKLKLIVDLFEDEQLDMLNTDTLLRPAVAKVLKEVARYDGDFVFGDSLPF